MSTATETTWDVFLSHGAQDVGIAEIVKRSLADAGLDVYAVDEIKPGEEFMSALRSAIAECGSFILILTRSTLDSPNIAFEIGAAMAWNKPIYVLYDGIAPSEIPDYLRGFRIAQISVIAEVVDEVLDSRKPVSDDDRAALMRIYQEIGVPTDQLIRKPLVLRELSQKFRDETKTNVGVEVLVQELIRLRKQGQLPRLHKSA